MQLLRFIHAQGLGSKKECQWLIKQEQIKINHIVCPDGNLDINPDTVKTLQVNEQYIPIIPLPFFYLLLYKPENFETSHRPHSYPSVFSLLPENFQRQNLQAVGRLDADTTGLLLMTNDGQYNHQLTAPKQHVSKIYEVTLKHPADETLVHKLCQGVLLNDETTPVQAKNAELINDQLLRLEIQEGKYHQVKRMIAAAGNRVEQLHRTHFGAYTLNGLTKGQWKLVEKR